MPFLLLGLSSTHLNRIKSLISLNLKKEKETITKLEIYTESLQCIKESLDTIDRGHTILKFYNECPLPTNEEELKPSKSFYFELSPQNEKDIIYDVLSGGYLPEIEEINHKVQFLLISGININYRIKKKKMKEKGIIN